MSTPLYVVIPGQPVPASRPRVARRGTYTERRYKQWKADASVLIRDAAVKQLGAVPEWPGDVYIYAEFHGAHGASDLDNLLKGVLDATQLSGVIVNDKQVKHLEALMYALPRKDKANARTEITINVMRDRGG